MHIHMYIMIPFVYDGFCFAVSFFCREHTTRTRMCTHPLTWRWSLSLLASGAFVSSLSSTPLDTLSHGAKVSVGSLRGISDESLLAVSRGSFLGGQGSLLSFLDMHIFIIFFFVRIEVKYAATWFCIGFICSSLMPPFQARRTYWPPVTLEPAPLARLDRSTLSSTPPMTSWPCSSRRSAQCSLMPTSI